MGEQELLRVHQCLWCGEECAVGVHVCLHLWLMLGGGACAVGVRQWWARQCLWCGEECAVGVHVCLHLWQLLGWWWVDGLKGVFGGEVWLAED